MWTPSVTKALVSRISQWIKSTYWTTKIAQNKHPPLVRDDLSHLCIFLLRVSKNPNFFLRYWANWSCLILIRVLGLLFLAFSILSSYFAFFFLTFSRIRADSSVSMRVWSPPRDSKNCIFLAWSISNWSRKLGTGYRPWFRLGLTQPMRTTTLCWVCQVS